MFPERLSTLWSLLRANAIGATVGGVGLLLILIGLFSIVGQREDREGVIFEPAERTASPSGSQAIFVDVAGAVVRPGVYQLTVDGRVRDALIQAGGLSAMADREWISRNLNLALKLRDGAKIYVPKRGESTAHSASSGQVGGVNTVSDGLVNINSATLSQLDKLPGVGPVTGQKIIDNRPYNDVNELVTKKVVGKKVFEQIKEKVTLY